MFHYIKLLKDKDAVEVVYTKMSRDELDVIEQALLSFGATSKDGLKKRAVRLLTFVQEVKARLAFLDRFDQRNERS
jgi:hypothetical protein